MPTVSGTRSPTWAASWSCSTCWQPFEAKLQDYLLTYRFAADTGFPARVLADSERSWTPLLGSRAPLDTIPGTRTDWGFLRCSMWFPDNQNLLIFQMLFYLPKEIKQLIFFLYVYLCSGCRIRSGNKYKLYCKKIAILILKQLQHKNFVVCSKGFEAEGFCQQKKLCKLYFF